MSSIAVILVRPREEGNVGAVARAMANMGLERLILVEPAPCLAGVARGFGVGGWEILDRVERVASFADAVGPFGRVVGTASRRQRPLSKHRVTTARQLPDVLAKDPSGTDTALVFGPEDNGLSRDELERCNPVISIPCSAAHPTLNLAQAVLVVAYELHMAGQAAASRAHNEEVAALVPDAAPESSGGSENDAEALATAAEVAALRQQTADFLLAVGYDQPHIRDGILRDLGHVLVRASASRREVRLARRVVRRAARAVRPAEPTE